ncbi:MAG TPA: twin-arginine translocase TatA/TatE family subunit [Lentimicrobium sp.]|jgi:TatA/E family protein of Tat protein translocase|nr:twin-arginine translocase TatA/TatE family subunit [Lentimicrobium sp.]
MVSGTLLFLDISGGEFMIILLAVFLIFGPRRMPEIARKLGRTMNDLKKASNDITREFREETGSIAREFGNARETLRKEGEEIRRSVMEAGQNPNTDHTENEAPPSDPYGIGDVSEPDAGEEGSGDQKA